MLNFVTGRNQSTLWIILALCVAVWSGCKSDDDNDDGENPSVSITSPTSTLSFLSWNQTVTLGGSAHDNQGVTSVKWEIDGGASGTADGTDTWSAALPLLDGDNWTTVRAFDESGRSASDTILLVYNPQLRFSTALQMQPDVVATDSATYVTFRVGIIPNPNLVPNSVTVYRSSYRGSLQDSALAVMYDDGNLANGDEIAGDGVFSTVAALYRSAAGTEYYRAVARVYSGPVELEERSALTSARVVQNVSSSTASAAVSSQEGANDVFDAVLATGTRAQAVDSARKWLLEQSNVRSVEVTGQGYLKITYQSDLIGLLMFVPDSTKGGGTPVSGERRNARPAVPAHRQTVGTAPRAGTRPHSGALDDGPGDITDTDVMIYAPWFTQFQGWGSEYADDIHDLIEDAPGSCYNMTYLRDAEATVDQVHAFAEHGLVIISTHGGLLDGEVVFLTGEQATLFSMAQHLFDWIAGDLLVTTMDGHSYWAIRPGFIEDLDEFPNSIIYNGSCESYANTSLAQAFFDRGAATYFGYTESVLSSFDFQMAMDVLPDLLFNGQTTGQTFVPGQHDSNTPPAEFMMAGRTDAILLTEFVNEDFEEGTLAGWDSFGDGRVIAQLGSESPYAGAFCGIISTGLGFTTQYGSLSQSFILESGQTTLNLRWNYLSEELPEWVGSQFQDYFEVSITDAQGVKHTLFYVDVDAIAANYAPVNVPGVVFDRGGVQMTGWRSLSVPISQFAGQCVTLRFEAGDRGDSIYDTAILLDNVEVQ